ncbi:MAG: hypothetical protein KKA90_04205 [Nanoarchaeota archaeon]|nr:hypothetical protein [Nanoarchaeota archaeon]
MKDAIIIVALLALIVFSGVQAMEIATVRGSEQHALADTAPDPTPPTKTSDAGAYNLPSNLENLNDMVGGC